MGDGLSGRGPAADPHAVVGTWAVSRGAVCPSMAGLPLGPHRDQCQDSKELQLPLKVLEAGQRVVSGEGCGLSCATEAQTGTGRQQKPRGLGNRLQSKSAHPGPGPCPERNASPLKTNQLGPSRVSGQVETCDVRGPDCGLRRWALTWGGASPPGPGPPPTFQASCGCSLHPEGRRPPLPARASLPSPHGDEHSRQAA